MGTGNQECGVDVREITPLLTRQYNNCKTHLFLTYLQLLTRLSIPRKKKKKTLGIVSEIQLLRLWATLGTNSKVGFTASFLRVSVELVHALLSWCEREVWFVLPAHDA